MSRGDGTCSRAYLGGDCLVKSKMGWSISRSLACVVAAATLLTVGCASQPGKGTASCVPPQLRLDAPSAHAGDVIDLHGVFFTDSCADTSYPPPVKPLRDLTVSLLEGGSSRLIGRVDAQGTRGHFLFTLRLPTDLKRGLATIRVGGAAEVGHDAEVPLTLT